MKNHVFEYAVRPETGGISSLVLCADPYAMNWCGHTKDWGVPVVMQAAKNRTFREPLELISSGERESVWENNELSVTLNDNRFAYTLNVVDHVLDLLRIDVLS